MTGDLPKEVTLKRAFGDFIVIGNHLKRILSKEYSMISKKAFLTLAGVILLMPSPDREETIRILNTRNNYAADDQRVVNEHLIRHPSNYDLAKHIVCTEGNPPEEISTEVLQWVRSNGWTYEP